MTKITIHAKPSTWKQIENVLICFSPTRPTQNIYEFIHSQQQNKQILVTVKFFFRSHFVTNS